MMESDVEYVSAQAEFMRISGGPADPLMRSEVALKLQRVREDRERLKREAQVHWRNAHCHPEAGDRSGGGGVAEVD